MILMRLVNTGVLVAMITSCRIRMGMIHHSARLVEKSAFDVFRPFSERFLLFGFFKHCATDCSSRHRQHLFC
jgi:hypothetical protein